MKLLPWPQPAPAGEGLLATRWVMDFDRKLAGTDLNAVAGRLRMQDPTLQAGITLERDDRMVIMFTWREKYDADAMSRPVVALQLITQVAGRTTKLLRWPATDWPFLQPGQ